MLSAALGDLSNYARAKLKELGKHHELVQRVSVPLSALPETLEEGEAETSPAEVTVNPGDQEASEDQVIQS